jgi:hypothetical protein
MAYGGKLTQLEDTFNFVWLSLRIVVEQVFVHFRSLRHFSVAYAMVLEEVHREYRGALHNFSIQTRGKAEAVSAPQQYADNDVRGETVVHMQVCCHRDDDSGRHVSRGPGPRRTWRPGARRGEYQSRFTTQGIFARL